MQPCFASERSEGGAGGWHFLSFPGPKRQLHADWDVSPDPAPLCPPRASRWISGALLGLDPALPVTPLCAGVADAALVYATQHKKNHRFAPPSQNPRMKEPAVHLPYTCGAGASAPHPALLQCALIQRPLRPAPTTANPALCVRQGWDRSSHSRCSSDKPKGVTSIISESAASCCNKFDCYL